MTFSVFFHCLFFVVFLKKKKKEKEKKGRKQKEKEKKSARKAQSRSTKLKEAAGGVVSEGNAWGRDLQRPRAGVEEDSGTVCS